MKIHSLPAKAHAHSKQIVSGALLFAFLQIPALPSSTSPILPLKLANTAEAQVRAEILKDPAMADIFLGDTPKAVQNAMIADQMEFVSTRKAYAPSLAVIEKHADAIKAEASEQGVPADVAIGVAFLENGGSETAKSPAGALGIYQLMPGTARNLGLTVNKTVDDRKSPAKSIKAGITYLAMNYERFGDWGLSTWAYHAGEGNVAKAIKIYAKANDGLTLEGIKNFGELRAYVEKNGITIHKLLSDPAVQAFTKKLNDDSSGYPYKVLATAQLFREAKDK